MQILRLLVVTDFHIIVTLIIEWIAAGCFPDENRVIFS